MRTEKIKKLIAKYEKFSQTFENDSLKSLFRNDILELYSEINNPDAEVYYTMGLFHYDDYELNTSKELLNERTKKALSFFEMSIDSDSNYYMSNYYLGHCYQDLGEYEQAIEYYLKVNQEKLKNDFPIWRYVLLFELIGFCYWKLEQQDIGMEYFKRTISEYLKQDYFDLFPIGDFIEKCLPESHSLMIEMKTYSEIKSAK